MVEIDLLGNREFVIELLDLLDFDELPEAPKEDSEIVSLCFRYFDLHGSRFFNRKFPDDIRIDERYTDWDFFCPSGLNYRSLLKQNGFEKCRYNQAYLDPGTEAVWYCPDQPMLQVVQKFNYKQYGALINLMNPFDYGCIWKKRIREDYPLFSNNQVKELIRAHMVRLYRAYNV